MTLNSDTIQQQHLRPAKAILAGLLLVLLVSGCASTPRTPIEEIDLQKAYADRTFEQAREAVRDFDYAKAIALLNASAKQGDAQAQYALGYMYYYGFGVIRDENIALELIQKAAAQGFPKAKTALKRVLIVSKKEQEQDREKSVLDARPSSNPPTGLDQRSLLMLQAEAIEQDQTVMPTLDDNPPETEPGYAAEDQTDLPVEADTTGENDSGNTETEAIETRSGQQDSNNSETVKTADALPIASSAVAAPTASDQAPAETTPGQDWILNQNPDKYTIQITSSSSEKRIRQYMEKYGLTSQATQFGLQRNDKSVVYIGVYGVYSSVAEANKALQTLPDEVKAAQPWVRGFDQLQEQLR